MRRGFASAATALGLVLAVAGCGGGSGGSAQPPPTPPPSSGDGTPSPGGGPSTVRPPTDPTLDDYVADCRRLDRELRFGRFVYPDGLHMVRGRSTTVRAAVTLGAAKPPAQLLHSSGSTHTVSVLVSCQVEAQLTGDAGVFEISDTGWQSRSLLTSKTAEWIWFVDPRRGGDQTLAVNVRPVVRIEERDGGRQVSSIVASTQTFDISVAVQVPPEEAAREGLDRTKVLLLSVGGLLAAVAVVVSAALGLWRIRGRRETGAAGDPGSDGDAAGAG